MGGLFVAGGDAAEVLELVEEALDEVSLSIEFVIDRTLDLAIAAGGDMRPPAAALDQIDDGAGVVAAIGDDVAAGRQRFEQGRGSGLVGSLATELAVFGHSGNVEEKMENLRADPRS
ncbi:MAG: hypothetical protein IT562_07095 [Alphaproteobacteria bacterium]|nr:hypothetical protein [Alphaproteobacteria bacterium]